MISTLHYFPLPLPSAPYPVSFPNLCLYFNAINNSLNLISDAHMEIDVWPSPGTAATSPKVSDSPFFNSHQLPVAPTMEVGLGCPSPIHSGMFTGLRLCSSYAGSKSCCELTDKAVMYGSHHFAALLVCSFLNSFCTLSWKFPESLTRRG